MGTVLYRSVPTVPLVLCAHCSSGPLYPLVLCSYFSIVLLILCALCSSGPLCPLFTDPPYLLTLPFCYIHLLIISYFRTRYMRDYPTFFFRPFVTYKVKKNVASKCTIIYISTDEAMSFLIQIFTRKSKDFSCGG